jgi:hypothetical protein
MPGGGTFAGSFELRNVADSGISRVGPIAVVGARPAHARSKVNPLAVCTVRWSPDDLMPIMTTCGNLLSTRVFLQIAASFHLQFSQRIVSQ